MRIGYRTSPTLERLRHEVRDWLDQELPAEREGFLWLFEEDPDQWEFYRQFWRKQGAKRWLEPTWPVEYGGAAMSAAEARVIREEFARRRAGAIAGIGRLVGPAILKHGTAEQKAEFLPRMAAGEIMWAECYSEPDAGSDLAALRTQAVQDGDDWIINGQKTFCTAGHHLNWAIIAARTDPDRSKRHEGISFFLSPMDAPGIELRPLHNLGGGRQNVVFFDNLRVPGSRLLGGLNQGWRHVWLGLGGSPIPEYAGPDDEQTIPYEPPRTEDDWVLSQVIDYCRKAERDGAPLIRDPIVRQQLVELAIGVEIERLMAAESSCPYGIHLHKAITKEFVPRFAQLAMDIVGPLGLIQDGERAPLGGLVDRIYRRSFGNHAGGTSQIKRLIAATRYLGLPR